MEVALRRHRLVPLVLATLALAALVSAALLAPTSALALENAKVTVNEEVGGLPTRFTFEGQTANDATVTALSMTFPEGFDLEKARVEALTLQGLKRVPVDVKTITKGQSIDVKFDPEIAPDSTLRIYVYDVVPPIKGGASVLKMTYDAGGVTKEVTGLKFSFITPSRAEMVSRWLDTQQWVAEFNGVKGLSLFFKPQLIALSIPLLFMGWVLSIAFVIFAFPLAITGGLALAFAKMSKLAPLRWIAGAYVNIIRGTPLFLQMFVFFIGLRIAGIRVNDFATAVAVLALNSSAYLTEIFRAGIQSIHKGQFEAASSLGMSYRQSMQYVIIPQTVKRVLPTMTSEFILLFKDTALLSALGVIELMYRANSIVSRTGNLTPFVVAAVYYLIVTIPLINWVGRLEAKLALAEGGQGGAAAPKPKRPAMEGFTRTESPAPEVAADTDADAEGR